MTPQEVKLWNWLREGPERQGFHFRKQVPFGNLIVDFACLKAKLVIELDGGQHGSNEGLAIDEMRDAILNGQRFRVLRFWNHEVDREKDMVMDTIHAHLADPSLAPPVRRCAPATLP